MGIKYHAKSEAIDLAALPANNVDAFADALAAALRLQSEAFTIVFVDWPNHAGFFVASPECCSPVWTALTHRLLIVNVGLGPSRACEFGPISGPGYFSPSAQLPADPANNADATAYAQLAALCHRASMHLIAPSLFTMRPAKLWTSRVDVVLLDLDPAAPLERTWVDDYVTALATIDGEILVNVRVVNSCAPYCAEAIELASTVRPGVVNATLLWRLLRPEFAPVQSEPSFSVIVISAPRLRGFNQGNAPAGDFADGFIMLGDRTVGATASRYVCSSGNATASHAPKVAQARGALAGTLRGMFGVSPTHLRWSSGRDGFVPDYIFSTGHTPFGPLSPSLKASQALLDAVRRNSVVAHLTETLAMVDGLRSVVADQGSEDDQDALAECDRAVRRSLVLLGLYDFSHAIVYALSARATARFIEASASWTVSVECGGQDARSFELALVASLGATGAVALAYDAWVSRRSRFTSSLVGGVGARARSAREKKHS